ncbi:hypothetical protein AB0E62_36535 [Streptomyces sp. NPDC038707]|uniref:hypothetical protein n=1 Tax=Streptomyces sp. NPDC038707 TaxID=3154329 RepID=UPI0033EE74A9
MSDAHARTLRSGRAALALAALALTSPVAVLVPRPDATQLPASAPDTASEADSPAQSSHPSDRIGRHTDRYGARPRLLRASAL